jgi:hypothetical protein
MPSIGDRIEQIAPAHYRGRVWQVDTVDPHLLLLRLVTPRSDRADSIAVGMVREATATWVENHCRPWQPPRIEPPCGDGEQYIRVYDGNDLLLEHTRFDQNSMMLNVVADRFRCDDDPEDLLIGWFGYCPDAYDETPDMYARWVNGEVIWSETP